LRIEGVRDNPLSSPAGSYLARFLSAFGIYGHGVLLGLVLGIPWLVVASECLWITRRDACYRQLAYAWTKVLAIVFGTGAASGTLMEFGLFTVWPEFIRLGGLYLFYPFFLEVFAFLAEVTLIVLYWVSWDKLAGTWTHVAIGVGVALGSNISGFFITSVNVFMQYPMLGASVVNGQLQVDVVRAFLNEASVIIGAHAILGGWVYAFGLVMALYAYRLLRAVGSEQMNWAAFKLASLAFAIPIPVIAFLGDQQGKLLAKYTPATLAALEGARETIPSGFPNLLAYGDWNTPIKGLVEYPVDFQHPLLYLQWYSKIGLAVMMGLIALIIALKVIRGKGISRTWLSLSIFAAFLAIAVNILGWYVKEVGRQPWVIYGLVKVTDILSPTFEITPTAVAAVSGMLLLAVLGISYTVYMIAYKK
jgi:cytochrome d ubiquinol oxidase subunit I